MTTPFEPDIELTKPTVRPLKVYAFDPSAGRLLGNYMTVSVEYEPLEQGPIGRKLAVIDYDGARKTYYEPVNLDDPSILIRDGIEPTQSDPRFHQQMVYAVAAETLQHFETALGRSSEWRRQNRLFLFPHAMMQANAFYSPTAHGILFGYFRASTTHPGRNLPGQTVFTCLSHDIIAHEMTHAIVDGIRQYFIEPTNIDVPAFHEAFADLAALFRHFTHKEALLDTLQKTGGQLFRFQVDPNAGASSKSPVIQAQIAAANPLIQLAQQFGEAFGMHAGLRSALGIVNAKDIETKSEPHARGAILVAAVFDAYFTVYTRRTANLFRIYRAGGGSANPIDLPGPLAEMLAAEASRTAERFFTTCARALDFCPPVDITFGDFLRAVITAHLDLDHDDPDGVRDAFMEAFRLRGIVAQSADFFSEDALCWPKPDSNLPSIAGLIFGNLNGLNQRQKRVNGQVLGTYAKENAARLGFDLKRGPIAVSSFHPVFRPRTDGRVDVDMIVELVQTQKVSFGEEARGLGTFPMRSGVTLAVAQLPSNRRNSPDRYNEANQQLAVAAPALDEDKNPDPGIRFVIQKRYSEERQEYQRQSYLTTGLAARGNDDHRYRIDFGLIHGGF
jgi:hypothetical protein